MIELGRKAILLDPRSVKTGRAAKKQTPINSLKVYIIAANDAGQAAPSDTVSTVVP